MKSSTGDIVQQLDQVRVNIDAFTPDDAQARRDLRASALALASTLSSPEDIFADAFYQPALAVAILVAMEAQWLQCLAGESAPLSATELSQRTQTSRSTIVRFMRVLTSHRIVTEDDTEKYIANSNTRWLTTPAALAGAQILYPATAEACLQLPNWYASRKFAEPTSLKDGPFFATFKKTFWDSLRDDPAKHAAFSLSMEGVYEEDAIKSDAELIGRKLKQAADMQVGDVKDVLLVDIGGGTGHLLRTFRKLHRELPGKLVLQDRASVIDKVDSKIMEGIDLIAYDFFDPQPIKYAEAYSLRHVLHDWSDEDCRKILANTCAVMRKGYSKLYIMDILLPDQGCSVTSALQDIMLLALFCGKERSKRQFEELLGSVGLRITEVFVSDASTAEAVIETELI